MEQMDVETQKQDDPTFLDKPLKQSTIICREEGCNGTVSFKNMTEFKSHLIERHQFVVDNETLMFSSYEEFSAWKENHEVSNRSQYTKRKTSKRKDATVEYWYCHRSGSYQSQSRGLRKPKSKGTNKINCNCIATLHVTTSLCDGKVHVEACHTHYGHEIELQHMRLPKSDRQYIAQKLAEGCSKKNILETLYHSNKDVLGRKHLAGRRDLNNIAKAHGLKVHESKEPELSVDDFVRDEILYNRKTVLMYKKPREEECMTAEQDDLLINLELRDFALGIMTDFQKRMFCQFGRHVLCFNVIKGRNFNSLYLITLLVVDEFCEAIPVAWLISNRDDALVLNIFFQQIRKTAGFITPEVIVSDKGNNYHVLWSEIFGGEPIKFISRWQIYAELRTELAMISNKDLATNILKEVSQLMQEVDVEQFEVMAQDFVSRMKSDENTLEFAEYFSSEWLTCKTEWAPCYTRACNIKYDINNNTYEDKLSKSILHCNYLDGGRNKRVDRCVAMLMDFIKTESKKYDNKLEQGKISWKSSELDNRHKYATELPLSLVTNVSPNTYYISCEASLKDATFDGIKYTVTISDGDCPNCSSCVCKTCVHLSFCSCPDHAVYSNICIHIHLTKMFVNKHISNLASLEKRHDETSMAIENLERTYEEIVSEADTLTTALSQPSPYSQQEIYLTPDKQFIRDVITRHQTKASFEQEKEKVISDMMKLSEDIKNCQNPNLIQTIRQQIEFTKRLLDEEAAKHKPIIIKFDPIDPNGVFVHAVSSSSEPCTIFPQPVSVTSQIGDATSPQPYKLIAQPLIPGTAMYKKIMPKIMPN